MTKKPIDDQQPGIGRREVLECMVWAGTGVLWGMSGGVPHSVGLIGEAAAAESTGFTFLQMSDSHIGFDKKANPDALGTLRECAPDDRLRDEAIHTFFCCAMDCFASLAMTKHCNKHPPSRRRGASQTNPPILPV